MQSILHNEKIKNFYHYETDHKRNELKIAVMLNSINIQ